MPMAMAGCCPWAIARDVTTPAPRAAATAPLHQSVFVSFLYMRTRLSQRRDFPLTYHLARHPFH
jgi:hypothetical protein